MPSKNPEKLYKELEALLCRLIGFDTTNPPGNELPLAKYLAGLLEGEGISAEVFESAPGRGILVGRLKGDGSKKPLLLMGHSDVVPVTAEDWKSPPFEGTIRDGCVFGRGALDCKCTVATEALVLLELKRRGVKLKRDIIYFVPGDEECMGTHGIAWMIDNHYDKIDAEFCINEGGGQALPFGGRNIYICQNAEKGAILLKLTTRGEPGHGSVPKKDNAIARMAAALNAIASNPAPIRKNKSVAEMIRRMGTLLPFPQGLVFNQIFNPLLSDFVVSQIPVDDLRDAFRAMLRDTASLTQVNGGYKENVIPEKCEAVVDCRTLPGTTQEDLIARLRKLTGVEQIEPLHPEKVPYATESPVDTELFRAIEDVIREYDPTAIVAPIVFPAATDSRFLRARGMVSYGFHPMRSQTNPTDYLNTSHGIDERIPVDALHFGFDAMMDIVLRLAT